MPEPHPRLTVNHRSCPLESSLAEDLGLLREAGATRAGFLARKLDAAGWDAGVAAVAASGIETTHLIHSAWFTLTDPARWDEERARAIRSLDTARQLGASIVYGTTGPPGSLLWEDAVAAFAEAVAPVAAHARRSGVHLALETTNQQFHDLDVLHTLEQTVDVCLANDLDVCFDVHAAFSGRGLREQLRRARGRVALVQISDYVPGERTVGRSVPGTGIIPLRQLLGWVLEDGYDGPVDLEVFEVPDGPVVELIRDSLAAATPLLDELGA